MCGIFGYVGPRNSAQICLDGLRHLEYRGYDSAGIAGIQDGKLLSCKEVGKLHTLETSLKNEALSLELAIAHTRWATHGKPTKENAHPHFDEHNRIAVVHNGIIENHNELRDALLAKGVTFKSDTDSEVIAQLIAQHYEGDFLAAVQKTLSQLQGFWGLAIIHKDHPDQIIAAARENPIAIGYNLERKEAAVSSDANAFSSHDLHVLFLHNDEIAVIKAGEVDVYDQ
ncbi:MAG TPA: glutamine--fructose-6-phosphate aminotransferase, partial [Rhabdochlamydiaceae bacterium]